MLVNVLNQSSGKNWWLYHGDSCEVVKGIPDNSIDLNLFSPPFGNLYIYSDSVADMGNSGSHEEFAEHYRYLVGEMLRITKPGRLCVVHCKDLPLYKGRDGVMGLYDFPKLLSNIHDDAGWTYHSRITIWKDPVVEMQRTKNHGLLYKNLCKDSSGSRQGMADYILVFRKWGGEFNDPVNNGSHEVVNSETQESELKENERFSYYVGTSPPDPTLIADQFRFVQPIPDKWGKWPKRNPFPPDSEAFRIWSIKCWQKYASPVWFDIDQMNVLNERAARDNADCKHICPLQLDVIERCIHLWSNEGDVIFTPFAGIGSELYVSLKCKRNAIGIELKESYFKQASSYIAILENELGKSSLFDSTDLLSDLNPEEEPLDELVGIDKDSL